MHTFLLIIQTVLNKEFENKIPIRYLNGSVEKNCEFYEEQVKYESMLPAEKEED